MELQIALDRIPLDARPRRHPLRRAAGRLDRGRHVAGQAVRRRRGRAVVAAAGGTPVLADLKTADDAAYEFALASDAGAGSVTVLGLAADVTLDIAVRIAAEPGGRWSST